MPSLQRLTADHATELLRFEREYFARFISDRGDGYFATFAERTRNSSPTRRRACSTSTS